jgi:hypothetical protein
VRKKTRIRSITAPTANYVSGVLILDVASVLDRGNTLAKATDLLNPTIQITGWVVVLVTI